MKLQIVRLHAAAFTFYKKPTISVSELAAEVEVAEGTIYRWLRENQDEWNAALDELGFTGERKFFRQPRRSLQRDAGETVEQAFTLIDQLTADGLTSKQAVTRTAELLFPDEDTRKARRRVYEWNRRRRNAR